MNCGTIAMVTFDQKVARLFRGEWGWDGYVCQIRAVFTLLYGIAL
jgi:hypothetical protein